MFKARMQQVISRLNSRQDRFSEHMENQKNIGNVLEGFRKCLKYSKEIFT